MKIGLFGIGLNTYWTQFEGLLSSILEGYRRRIADRLAETGAEVVDAGMVDEPAKAEAAAKLLRENGAELVFLYISGRMRFRRPYCPSYSGWAFRSSC